MDPTEMTGRQQLQAMIEGLAPRAPISETIGMIDFVLSDDEASVAVSLDPEHRHYNPLGTMHGGVVSTLLDTAAACSVHATLAAGERYTSLDLTVKFLRAITVDTGRIRAVGSVLQRGRRTALAQARLHDARGTLLAHATSTCLIVGSPA